MSKRKTATDETAQILEGESTKRVSRRSTAAEADAPVKASRKKRTAEAAETPAPTSKKGRSQEAETEEPPATAPVKSRKPRVRAKQQEEESEDGVHPSPVQVNMTAPVASPAVLSIAGRVKSEIASPVRSPIAKVSVPLVAADDRLRINPVAATAPPPQLPPLPTTAPVETLSVVQRDVAPQPSAQSDEEESNDSEELQAVWTQCLQALFTCSLYTGPIFAAVVLFCYAVGKITVNKAVASIGVAYASLFLLIMGSYVVAIVPFVLVSKMVTQSVFFGSNKEKDSEVHVRLFLFLLIAMSGIVCVVAHGWTWLVAAATASMAPDAVAK